MEEKPTYINWCDHIALPTLNQNTVIDYFCKPTNPFYDKTCNNEHLRMQGFGLASEQLKSMEGFEYKLLHTQPPDLYVIRKQHRSSPSQETPLIDYYIIRGVVYQAPDLASVVNVRLLNAVHAVRRALDEASSRSRFTMSKTAAVTWMTSETSQQPDAQQQSGKRTGGPSGTSTKNRQNDPDRPPTAFQKMHVNKVIASWTASFPTPVQSATGPTTSGSAVQPTQQVVPADKPSQQVQDSQQASANVVKRSKLT